MTTPDGLRDEAARLTVLPESELYAFLLPADEQVAFSKGGRVARGKEVFVYLWRDAGPAVCKYYHANAKSFGTQVDAVALIAAPLLGQPAFRGISVVAFAALAVKIGFDKLCRGGG